MIGLLGAIWGFSGVILLIGFTLFRLTPIAIEAFEYELLWYHWAALVSNILFMLYSEAYRGFQKGFSPRVAARCKYLYQNPKALHILLAPLFCIGYFHVLRNRQRHIIALTTAIIILIIVIQRIDQPWRGIIDVGVVVGLSWGLITLFVFAAKAALSEDFDYSPEVPEPNEAEQRLI